MDYHDFILRIGPGASPNTFAVSASSAGEGEARGTFSPPFDETQLENFVLKIGLTRRGVRRIHSQEWQAAEAFGQKIFSALFTDELRALLHTSRNTAHREGKGLRIKIVLDAPALANYPWEYLYDPALGRFTTLFQNTSLVRYMELPLPLTPLQVAPPLHVLVLTCSPRDYQPLDVQGERDALARPLGELERRGLLTVRWLEHATLDSLRGVLSSDGFHVFHFIGHGAFDESSKDGVLIFKDPSGQGRPISVEQLAILLGNHPTLRLVVLNACEGARTSVQDPFAGAAMTLVRTGQIPAVVAMQFEISDNASIAFSLGFYEAIAKGKPLDAAVTDGRLAIFAQDNDVEWGTPVLYLRAPDGVIFAPSMLEKPGHLERLPVKEEPSAPEQIGIVQPPEPEPHEPGRTRVEPHAEESVEPEALASEQAVTEPTEVQPAAREIAEAEHLKAAETKGGHPAPESLQMKTITAEKQVEEHPRPGQVPGPRSQSHAPRSVVALVVTTFILLCTACTCFVARAFLISLAPTGTPTSVPIQTTTAAATLWATAAPSSSGAPSSPTFTSAITAPRQGRGVGRIAFGSNRDGHWQIYIMTADGSGLTRLTQDPKDFQSPAWSPDAKRIAFHSVQSGIYVIDSDGSNLTQLTGGGGGQLPAWSPDGKHIAFNSGRDGSWQTYIMNADGSAAVRLTSPPGENTEPRWSPDGGRIAFSSNRDGNWEIYVMNGDGSGATRLTKDTANDGNPAWSPDGRRIAFTSNRDGNWEIYLMNSDGSGITRLTNNSFEDDHPAWSPDGERLALVSVRGGKEQIYVMRSDGSQVTPLSDGVTRDTFPAWQP